MDLSKSGKHVSLLESRLASALQELELLNSEQTSLSMNKSDLEAAKAEVQAKANDLAEQLSQSKVRAGSMRPQTVPLFQLHLFHTF